MQLERWDGAVSGGTVQLEWWDGAVRAVGRCC